MVVDVGGLGEIVEVVEIRTRRKVECERNRRVLALPGAEVVKGFGASDCRCVAHLAHFAERPTAGSFTRLVGA